MEKEEVINHMGLIEENYNILFSNLNKQDEECNIGRSQNKVCRFCGRNEQETTFDTIAHAIPECLGNKQIICLDECDNCNKDFANNIEDHLAAITLPYRVINMIEGKKKIPSYQTQDQKSKINIEDAENKFMKIISRENSEFLVLDEENKNIRIEYDLPSHIPSAAYKTLVKMALSIMSNEQIKNFTILNSWIQEKDHNKTLMNPLNVFMTFIPGINPFKETTVFLLKKYTKREEYPDSMFILAFGNVMYQIVLPNDIEIKQKASTKTLLKFLTPFEINWNLGRPTHRTLDWSQNTKLKSFKQFMNFSYDESIKLDPKNIKL